MTAEVPKWAFDWLRTRLPEGAEVINALLLEKGRYSGSVLANTTRGAILLTKSSVGEPKMTFLPLPGEVVAVTCESCGQSMELHNTTPPVDVYCSRCGRRHHVAAKPAKPTGAAAPKIEPKK